MSSEHPVTTDTVSFGRTSSPEPTSDYSGSHGEPTLVHWRRRPNEAYGYPQSGNTTGGSSVVGGVCNPLTIEVPASPTKPVEDVDFDTKPSATYQSIDAVRHATAPAYEDLSKLGREDRRQTSGKCPVCFVGCVALTAFVVACCAAGLASYAAFVKRSPQEENITELETQLSAAKAVTDQLTSMLEELRQNVTRATASKNGEIEQLSLQVTNLHNSVEEILNPATEPVPEPVPARTVNVSQNCAYEKVHTCRIDQTQFTQVHDSSEDYPNYNGCSTVEVSLSETGTHIQDVYCAITNPREELNPMMATIRHDEESNSVLCVCFVTGIEVRRGVVDCSLFVRRCPDIVEVV